MTSSSGLPDSRVLRLKPVRVDTADPTVPAALFLDFRDSGDDDCKNPVPVSSRSTERKADWRSALEFLGALLRSRRLWPLPGASAGLSLTSSARSANRGEDFGGAAGCTTDLGAEDPPTPAAVVCRDEARLRGVELGAVAAWSVVAETLSRSYGSGRP